jgi:hypothetical protein
MPFPIRRCPPRLPSLAATVKRRRLPRTPLRSLTSPLRMSRPTGKGKIAELIATSGAGHHRENWQLTAPAGRLSIAVALSVSVLLERMGTRTLATTGCHPQGLCARDAGRPARQLINPRASQPQEPVSFLYAPCYLSRLSTRRRIAAHQIHIVTSLAEISIPSLHGVARRAGVDVQLSVCGERAPPAGVALNRTCRGKS